MVSELSTLRGVNHDKLPSHPSIHAGEFINQPAVFCGPDRTYRYSLKRPTRFTGIDPLGAVLFICLNPSTADENTLDPTVRKCIGFARLWGYGTVYIGNVSPFRATIPADMKKRGLEPDYIQKQNLAAL